jgi:3-oxoacyl-[acyl-carrier protein] reductase
MIGKYAVITGASRGLGENLAQRFWDAGYELGLLGRSADSLARRAAQFDRRDGRRCDVFVCDLGDPTATQRAIAEIVSTVPRVNVLINNAAVQGPIGSLATNDLSEWRRAIQVDLLSPVALCQGLLAPMVSAPDASIINLSGGGAAGPRSNFSAYATAKAALVRFSETLAQEVKDQGITVNCIAPGAMKTAMLAETLDRGSAAAGAREFATAAKAFEDGGASLDRVADLALFLCSPAARGITGKLVSAIWDNWEAWPNHVTELAASDLYTLRRIAGRDRGCGWGDK